MSIDFDRREAAKRGRRALAYSAAGHFLFHYFAAMYFTLVLAIAQDWTASDYEALIALWTPASALIGLAALPAGRLADRWSAPGMLAVMFLGMGAATAVCGFASEPMMLGVMLAGIGLFGAIYHPVGISWLIRTSAGATGQKLALNGVFGGLGAAAAGALTGLLVELVGWRGAFLAPGLVCVAVGLALVWHLRTGRVVKGESAAAGAAGGRDGRGDGFAFAALLFPMFAIGLIYATTQAALPKLFEEEARGWLGGDIGRIGLAVGAVYSVGAVMQLVGGRLADRYSLKLVYGLSWLVMGPLLLLMAQFGEMVLILAAMALVVVNSSALPAENLMLARFAPARHQGLAFGVKFVLAFGAGPIGVLMIKYGREWSGDFTAILLGLAGMAALAVLAVLFLPADRAARAAAAAE